MSDASGLDISKTLLIFPTPILVETPEVFENYSNQYDELQSKIEHVKIYIHDGTY